MVECDILKLKVVDMSIMVENEENQKIYNVTPKP